MEVIAGSCRLGLWFVHVHWAGGTVYGVRFSKTGIYGPVPPLIRQYCSGKPVNPVSLDSTALQAGGIHARIYHVVRKIPYGRTMTYGEIASLTGTAPRVVGQAMAHNPTPLVIPCHRVVGVRGIGGFTPSPEIKEMLLAMEKKSAHKIPSEKNK